MAQRESASNTRSVSTTWGYKKVMLRGPRPPQDDRAGVAGSAPLRTRDPRKELWLSVKYSGGAEAWWVIESRGREWRFPGHLCLQDVMDRINRSHLTS